MRVAIGVDLNKAAIRTFGYNFPAAEAIEGSVRSRKILKRCASLLRSLSGRSSPSVIVSGPPCQGFSAAGSRSPSDPRNQILLAVARAVVELKPHCALLENVSTVLASKYGVRLAKLEDILNGAGYFVQNVLVDAAAFGVAQKRRRAFFLVSQCELSTKDISDRLEQLARPRNNVAAALKGLPKPRVRPDNYTDDCDYGGIPNHFAMRHSKHVMDKIAALEPGTGPMSYRRLHPSRPSNTLFSGHRAPPAHFAEPRSITVREAARLQGFPDTFRVYGSFANQMEQVTNAVPPPLARGVARAGRPDGSSSLMSKTTNGSSLADKIRATKTTRTPVQTPLKTDQRVLARITDGIYRQPASALRELISNAYDADATEVIILTDAPRFSVISIRDNGLGLTPESLQHLVEHIGGSPKRTSEGADLLVTTRDDPTRSPGGRQLIGKLGIGLFSVAQFTHHFLMITKTRGDRFRTVADITLGPVDQEHNPPNTERGGHHEITTGHAQIWTERAADIESQGTEVKLLELLPRTQAELASLDLWAKIDFEKETEGKVLTRTPDFHIGRMDPKDPEVFSVEPRLPWTEKDKPRARFEKLVAAVRGLAGTDKDLVDLEAVCDRYLQTLWTLGLAAPLDYLQGHPFDLAANGEFLPYQLENRTRGQAELLKPKKGESLRTVLNLRSPNLRRGDHFEVFVDGMQLFRPLLFLKQPKTQNAVKTPLLCAGRCREEFVDKPVSLRTGESITVGIIGVWRRSSILAASRQREWSWRL